MPPNRNKKFERKKEPPEFRIQPRDHEILLQIAEHRLLDAEQIFALSGGGQRNLRRRLALLYHHGFIEKPMAQKQLPHGSFTVYSLGAKGAELLDRKIFIKNKDFGFPYLDHALMISQFRSILMLALKKHPSRPKLSRWLQGQELKDVLRSHGRSPELVPDAYFTIDDNGELLDFFLEADRSTMTRERFLDKMKIYWRWWRERRFEDSLGFQAFRVLSITISQERADNLREITREADDRQTGSNMFLFLPKTAYSLSQPESLLEPIWKTAKGERHSILE